MPCVSRFYGIVIAMYFDEANHAGRPHFHAEYAGAEASFPDDQLLDNYSAVIDEIIRAKPSASKGKYIRSATLATTMGPGVRVDTGKAIDREMVGATAAEPASAE